MKLCMEIRIAPACRSARSARGWRHDRAHGTAPSRRATSAGIGIAIAGNDAAVRQFHHQGGIVGAAIEIDQQPRPAAQHGRPRHRRRPAPASPQRRRCHRRYGFRTSGAAQAQICHNPAAARWRHGRTETAAGLSVPGAGGISVKGASIVPRLVKAGDPPAQAHP